ncbi:class I SAM-dependent methyltransferase [Foetidibacter luteolus]|uniref:class I SAM-dependent methyltransferase n=1 Tax=Foetidibacter luteolus TaxID=2608880 RepID=UPI001A98A11B|nr:methyltransferase [Foetidibacter luteolus]
MLTFLKAAFGNLKQTGSVMESSPQLSRRMTRIINFKKPVHIVELGAGTGSITKHILAQMGYGSSLMSFEINESLFERLQQVQDKRFTGVNDNVLQLQDYAAEQSADYIISGLPLANICAEQKMKILNACKKVLKPGGYYIQFQYSLNDIKLLKQKFLSVSCGFALLNFPPAFVYYAKK